MPKELKLKATTPDNQVVGTPRDKLSVQEYAFITQLEKKGLKIKERERHA